MKTKKKVGKVEKMAFTEALQSKKIVLLMIMLMAFLVVLPVINAELYENYQINDDTQKGFFVANRIYGNSFTIGNVSTNEAFDLEMVGTKYYWQGTNQTCKLQAFIHEEDGSNKPTGSILSSGEIDISDDVSATGEWINISMSALSMNASGKYTVSFTVNCWNGVNYPQIRADESSPTYAGGTYFQSTDNSTYSAFGSLDLMFEIYGTAPFLNLTDQLFAYWDFNSESGSVLSEKVTGAVNGTTRNQTDGTIEGKWTTGIIGNSLYFNDAETDYVDAMGDYTPNKIYAFSTWFYNNNSINSSSSSEALFNVDNTDSYGIRFGASTGSCTNEVITWMSNNARECYINSSHNIEAGWHHLAMTYNATASGFEMYLDGVQLVTQTVATPVAWNPSAVVVATNRFETSNFFNGRIDELGFWNKSLSEEEILILYNSSSGYDLNFSTAFTGESLKVGLISYHDFNALSGDLIEHIKGDANGTLFNNPLWVSSKNSRLDYALEFDGSTQYVEELMPTYAGDGNIQSASVWFYNNEVINSTSSSSSIYNFNSADAYGLALGSSTGVCADEVFDFITKNGRSCFENSTYNVEVGWHNVVATKDGATWNLYFDGVQLTMTDYLTHDGFTLNKLSVAVNRHGTSGFFNGKVDELATWSRVLGASEKEALWNASEGYDFNYSHTPPDFIAPNLTLDSPLNTTYNIAQTEIIYTAEDNVNLSTCWYSLDGGSTQIGYDLNCDGNFSGLSANEGDNIWVVYTNDTAGQGNSSSVTFFQDTQAPSINLSTPTNATHIDQPVNFTVNIGDISGIANATLYIRNATDDSLEHSEVITISGSPLYATVGAVVNLSSEGEYYWYYESSDIYGFLGTSDSNVIILDTITPLIVWYNPVESSNPITTNPTFVINANISDPYLDAVNVTVYNSAGVETYNNFTQNLTVTEFVVGDTITLSEGLNIIDISARDSLESSPHIRDLTQLNKNFDDNNEFWDISINDITIRRTSYIINNGGNKVNRQDWNLDITDEWDSEGQHIKTNISSDKLQNKNWGIRVDFECIEGCSYMEFLDDRGVDRIVDSNRNLFFNYDDAVVEGWDVQYAENNGIVSVVIAYPNKAFYDAITGTQVIDPITAGLNTITKTENVTLDTTAPTGESGGYGGSGTSPSNNTYTSVNATNFTVNVTDPSGIANVTFILTNESDDIINQTVIDTGGQTNIFLGIMYYLWYEGIYKWSYLVYDTVANFFTTTEAQITYDTIEPSGNIVYPLNTTYAGTITELNYTYVEANPHNCWYSTDIGVTNNTITCGNNVTGLSSVEGSNTWKLYINDSVNFINESSVTFTTDTTAPTITIYSPVDSTNYNTSLILLNVTTDETGFIWWSITDGSLNTTYTTTSTETFNEGTNQLDVWANDSVDNTNLETITFIVDTTAPIVVLDSINDSGTDSFPHLVNISYNITDSTITSCSYELDDFWYEDNFNDTTTTENLTFSKSGNEEVIKYLSIPEDREVDFAYINLSGYQSNSTFSPLPTNILTTSSCQSHFNPDRWYTEYSDYWKEYASCRGTVPSTEYWVLYEGNITDIVDFRGLGFKYLQYVDGLIDAESHSAEFWAYNYNTLGYDLVYSRDGIVSDLKDVIVNLDLDESDYVSGGTAKFKLRLNISSTGLAWSNQRTYGIGYYRTDYDGLQVTNQNMKDVTVDVGGDGSYEFEYYGNFSDTNNRTNNLNDEINTYLSTCSYVGGYCDVPIVFNSTTAGLLTYSDMYFAQGSGGVLVCNDTTASIPVETDGFYNLTIFGEDSLGFITNDTESFFVMEHQYIQSVDNNVTVEGDVATFTLGLDLSDPDTAINTEADLVYNNTHYPATNLQILGTNYTYTYNLVIPNGTGSLNGTTVAWYWQYTLPDYDVNTTTTSNNQLVYSLEVDDCTIYSNLILNLTLKDEETDTPMGVNTTSLIELELEIKSLFDDSVIALYEDTSDKELAVCIPTGLLNFSEYRIDFTVGYNADGYVQEFYYMENGTLDSTDYFNSYTTKNISLYDLEATESTTFLFDFTDFNGLPVPDGIVHVYRKYIGEGLFREVERAKQDDNGETHVHLVEEDVIYYFQVSQFGEIVYTSSTYNAKCLTAICTITLEASDEVFGFSEEFDSMPNGTYAVDVNEDTRTITLSFASDLVTEMNLSVWDYNAEGKIGFQTSLIESKILTATSGNVQIQIPESYGDKQFIASVHQNNGLLNTLYANLEASGKDVFGTFGVFLTALLVLTLMLMSATEGVPLIIFTLLGLALAMVIKLIEIDWIAYVSLVIAGLIIIVKLSNRRAQQ